jgi:CBS domain-containing protein
MPILVKDIMSTPPLTIDWNKTARDAARLMRKHRKGFLIVTKRGKAVGVLSDSDLLDSVILKNLEPRKVKVKDIMSSPVVVISPQETILDAVRKIKKSNIHRLPVVSEGKVLGVISLTDIARTSPEMLDLLEYRLKMKERPIVLKEKTTVGFCENCGNYSEKLKVKNGIWVCEICFEEEE